MKHKDFDFDTHYYTYTQTNIGKFEIVRFQIRDMNNVYIISTQGENINYDMIFLTAEAVGVAIDNKLKGLTKNESNNKEQE